MPIDTSEGTCAPRFDIIYVNCGAWPDLLKPLGDAIKAGKGNISQEIIDRFYDDSDHFGAFCFDGNYGDLLSVLVKHEFRLPLLSNLLRESSPIAMRTAIAFVTIDALADITVELSTTEKIAENLLLVASTRYAAPKDARLAILFAAKFAEVISMIPFERLPEVSGPRFVSSLRFEELKRDCLVTKHSILVSSDLELILTADA